MQSEKQIGLNEWLLGSTVLCHSCGCLWLIPSAQSGDSYRCRQCGSEVRVKGKADRTKQSQEVNKNSDLET
jgi:DNA-directed RNA polymerase subunit RPC12/RpoP